jgi:phosphate transport system substrate-binding protein
MKAILKKSIMDYAETNRNMPGKRVKNVLIIVVAMMCCLNLNAQNKSKEISIYTTQITRPLVERWANEYFAVNSEVKIKVSTSENEKNLYTIKAIPYTPDRNELGENEVAGKVARVVFLPVINAQNPLFAKELKKGLKYDELKAIFIREEIDEWETEEPDKEPLYTVYTKTPNSAIAQIISGYFDKPSSELKGVYVSGEDSDLLSALLQDSTGVAFGNLSLIYNTSGENLISGFKVLPVDLNGNGKLDKEEFVLTNSESVLSLLEASKNISVPNDYVNFVLNRELANPEIVNFISWVKQQGQRFNHEYGFLDIGAQQQDELTQK